MSDFDSDYEKAYRATSDAIIAAFGIPPHLVDPDYPMSGAARDKATEAAFLADVVANPADDTPRLIYADWLEDHGDPDRAEFIRVQVELARGFGMPPGGGAVVTGDRAADRREVALRRRERELLEANGWAWLGEVTLPPGSWGPQNLFDRFRRGFVGSVTLPLSAWLAHGPSLVRQAPLEEVRLSDKSPSAGDAPSHARNLSYYWTVSDEYGARYGLGRRLFTALPPQDLQAWSERMAACSEYYPGGPPGPSRNVRLYTSQAAALAALSDACLSLARAAR